MEDAMSTTVPTSRMTGIGRVLVIVYAVMALAATGRSFVQIFRQFDEAPLAYSLSALAAVVYILATLALVLASRRGWYAVAWVAIVFRARRSPGGRRSEHFFPDLFPHDTVWSMFGRGYLFIPLVLPIFGIWWLRTHRPTRETRSVLHAEASA